MHRSGLQIDIADEREVPSRENDRGPCVQAKVVAGQQHIKPACINGQQVMVGRPVGLVQSVNGGRNRASHAALVAQTSVAVVGGIVEHHVPAFGRDGRGNLPMEFKRSQSRFSAGRLSHHRPVRLAQFVRLNAVFIKKEHVEGIVNHNDAEVVNVPGLKRSEVHDDAHIGVDVEG